MFNPIVPRFRDLLLRAARPALLVETEQRYNARPIQAIFARFEAFGGCGRGLSPGPLAALRGFDSARDPRTENLGARNGRDINHFLVLEERALASGR